MDNRETINILCATDNNYAPYCGIMLTSLFDSNRDCRFNVYVFIDDDLSGINKKKYNKLGQKYGNIINLMKIDNSMIEGFPITPSHITRPTYYRLLAAELLPNDIHRVIYLDSDLVVVGDIKPLWNVDIEGKALAGIRGCSDFVQHHCERLNYPRLFDYFNAGVLIINLDYWRMMQLNEKLIAYVLGSSSSLLLMDQDVLNGVLYDKKLLLPSRYNFQVLLFTTQFWNHYTSELQQYYLDEVQHVCIVHYAGGEKPWSIRQYGGPFFSVWNKYRRISMWRKCCEIKPLKKRVKHVVKRYVFPDLFRRQHPEWVVVPENRRYYV